MAQRTMLFMLLFLLIFPVMQARNTRNVFLEDIGYTWTSYSTGITSTLVGRRCFKFSLKDRARMREIGMGEEEYCERCGRQYYKHDGWKDVPGCNGCKCCMNVYHKEQPEVSWKPFTCRRIWTRGDTLAIQYNDISEHTYCTVVLGLTWNKDKSLEGCDGCKCCKPVPKPQDSPYQHISPGCVSGRNIFRHRDKTLVQCKKLCDANSRCLSFEYGVFHNGSNNVYQIWDCVLNSGNNSKGCDGKKYNLDLYVKLATPDASPKVKSCRVELFQEPNYGGVQDVYTHSVDVWRNDDMSSFKVSPGCCVTLFEHSRRGGKSRQYCHNTPFVGSWWNNKVSSIQIERAPGTPYTCYFWTYSESRVLDTFKYSAKTYCTDMLGHTWNEDQSDTETPGCGGCKCCKKKGGMACFLKEHGCEHMCEDIDGIATCQCREGFTLQDDQKHCKKADPCTVKNGGCDHICLNRNGKASCKCKQDFRLLSDGKSCKGVWDGGYTKVGCYHDRSHRWGDIASSDAIRGKVKKISYDKDVIEECYKQALASRNTHFAIKFKVECYTSSIAHKTYDKHGPATGCVKGQGGDEMITVYKLLPVCDWKHLSPACVSRHNMKRYRSKSVEQCQQLCTADDECLSIEYGVDHGGSRRAYRTRECVLNSGTNSRTCNGKKNNLDLYVKGKCRSLDGLFNQKYHCHFSNGIPKSGSRIAMESQPTRYHCVAVCLNMKEKDFNVNGVMIKENQGLVECWCLKNATKILGKSDDQNKYQACVVTMKFEHKDVNECDEVRFGRKHGCQHLCINTVGSYKCGCRDGYALTKDGRTCKMVPDPQVLTVNQTLPLGGELVSKNGKFKVVMHHNGNLVLYGPDGEEMWQSYTYDIDIKDGLYFDKDGTLYLTEPDGFVAWSSGSVWCSPYSKSLGRCRVMKRFLVKNNGDMGSYDNKGRYHFHTDTDDWYKGWSQNETYETDTLYKNIGCFLNQRPRTITIKKFSPATSINKCYERAKSLGNSFFGVYNQYYCYTSKNAERTWSENGPTEGCIHGRGGYHKMSAYKILHPATVEMKTPIPCIDICKCNRFSGSIDCESEDIARTPQSFPEWTGYLNLRRTDLIAIPPSLFTGLYSLESLLLHENSIANIPANVFEDLLILHKLELQRNQITSIHFQAFSGLSSLQTLNLQHNKLTYLHKDVFRDLEELERLDLSHNNIAQIDKGVFRNLRNLKYLSLEGNNITILHPGAFAGLKNLKTLHLRDNKILELPQGIFDETDALDELTLANNNIHRIDANAFQGLTFVGRTMDLRNNRISKLPSGLFQNFKKLETLFLMSNNITELTDKTFVGIPRIVSLDLQNNNIQMISDHAFKTTPAVWTISLNGNRIAHISAEMFQGLKNLYQLYLHDNNIKSLPKNLFSQVGTSIYGGSLGYLTLHHNNISEIAAGAFAGLTQIDSLSLAKNNIKELPSDLFADMKKLSTLDLSHNKISEMFTLTKGLTTLRMGDNNIKELRKNQFQRSNGLKSLDLYGNTISIIEDGTFDMTPNLNKLNLGRNGITSLTRWFTEKSIGKMKHLKSLLLANNHIKELPADALPFENIKELKLAGNEGIQIQNSTFLAGVRKLDLSRCKISNIIPGLFHGVKKLSLADNLITSLDHHTFKGSKNMNLLDLSGNQIRKISPGTFNIPSDFHYWGTGLHLDLSRNNITSDVITKEMFQILKFEFYRPLNLTHNPLECTCGLYKSLMVHPNRANIYGNCDTSIDLHAVFKMSGKMLREARKSFCG